jgi:hypothetical protein
VAPRALARSKRGPGARLIAAGAILLLLASLGVPSAQQPDCLTLENFATGKVGELPSDWKVRKDDGKDVYSVQEEAGVRFLRAVSRGLGIQAAKEREWDLKTYPVLAWSWRPRQFPRGADERESGKNDSALAVYLLVPYSSIRGPKAVKYIWSERVPVATHLTSNAGLTQVRVLRSGPAAKDQWTEERVNVLEDYKRYFNEADAPKPAGIAVLTDADDTRSVAEGDYANFRACRK